MQRTSAELSHMVDQSTDRGTLISAASGTESPPPEPADKRLRTGAEDAEALVHSVVHIPEAKTLIVQDLAFANAHFFPLGNNANWTNVLTQG